MCPGQHPSPHPWDASPLPAWPGSGTNAAALDSPAPFLYFALVFGGILFWQTWDKGAGGSTGLARGGCIIWELLTALP